VTIRYARQELGVTFRFALRPSGVMIRCTRCRRTRVMFRSSRVMNRWASGVTIRCAQDAAPRDDP
jgi:hypothetical protein